MSCKNCYYVKQLEPIYCFRSTFDFLQHFDEENNNDPKDNESLQRVKSRSALTNKSSIFCHGHTRAMP